MKKVMSILLALTLFFSNALSFSSYAETLDENSLDIKWLNDYEEARDCSDGMIPVKKNGKWGFVNKEGKEIIPCIYGAVYDFEDGVAWVNKDRVEVIQENGQLLIENGGKYKLVDKNGKDLTDAIYSEVSYFSEGLSAVSRTGYNDYAYIDKTGKELIKTNYYFAHEFSEGLAAVITKDSKVGYIDKNGKEVIKAQYCPSELRGNGTSAHSFSEGLCVVGKSENGKERWFYIDKSGKEVLQIADFVRLQNFSQEPLVFDFSDGVVAVYKNGKYGVMDKTGKLLVDYKFDDIFEYKNGIAPCFIDDEYVYIDKTGKEVSQRYISLDYFHDGVAHVSNAVSLTVDGNSRDLYAFIDEKGKELTSFSYMLPGNYSEGLIKVLMANDKKGVGYINKTGELIIPLIFSTASDFSEGVAIVVKDSKIGILKNPLSNMKSEVEKNTASNSEKNEISSWAKIEVNKAISGKLVPENLQSLYKSDITRKDFAQLVVACIEAVENKSIDEVLKQKTGRNMDNILSFEKFKDSDDKNVISAKVLGIISGVGNNNFSPDGKITREQAATLLQRTAEFLGKNEEIESLNFVDDSDISNWAKQSVSFVSKLGIMNGVGDNKFSPKGSYTREQAYITIYRLFEKVK